MKKRATRRSQRGKRGPFRWLLGLAVCAVLVGMVYAATGRGTETVPGSAAKTITDTVKKNLHPSEKTPETKTEKPPAKKTEPQQKASPSSATREEGPLAALSGQKYHGKLAVIIDDCGYALDPVRTLTSLPFPFSYAVIPFKPNSSEALSIIKGSGHIAMLHLPMEPVSGGSSETRAVRVGMTAEQIQNYTREAIDSLPGIQGVNNHQGSKATSDGPTIRAALKVIGGDGLFFVDSRTISTSVAEKIARQEGILTGHNSMFLDNSSDIAAIQERIAEAIKDADRYGATIVICHARPNTAEAWRRSEAAVKTSGITLVPVTDLLQ